MLTKKTRTEDEKFSEVEDLFHFIMKVQDKLASEVATSQEASEGDRRKGVVLIRGSDERKWSRALVVDQGKLVVTRDLSDARTVIVFEGVDAFLRFCKELLGGSSSAFSRARARGEAKVVGSYGVRDAILINRILGRVGKILSDYDVEIGS